MKTDGRWSHSAREATLWLAIACILVSAIGFSWNPTPFAHALAAIFIACAIVHAGFFYGSRHALVLFVRRLGAVSLRASAAQTFATTVRASEQTILAAEICHWKVQISVT